MLYYVSTANLPSKKAHAVQQVRMCQAFQQSGVDVCMIYPDKNTSGKHASWESISRFYGLQTPFDIKSTPIFPSRFKSLPKLRVISMSGMMTLWLVSQVFSGKIDSSDIIYGRNYYGMFWFNEFRKTLPARRRPALVFETHTPISAHFKPRFFNSVDGIVSITHRLKQHLVGKYCLDESGVLVSPDGVDLDPYKDITKQEARATLGIPQNETIIMYTGHLYRGKGVGLLVRAAEELQESVYIVGGYEEDIERVKREAGSPENVVFTGFVDPANISLYQIAADILVAPYTEESRPWVSPLKLFEYMAAGRPIVASDREVLQEVLVHGENAILFEKGNVHDLRKKLTLIAGDHEKATALQTAVRKDAQKYTWKNRAQDILSFTKQIK